MTNKPDDRAELESVRAADRRGAESKDKLHAGRAKIAGGLFIFALVCMVLLANSCSDKKNDASPAPAAPSEAAPPAEPGGVDTPQVAPPAEPSIQEVRAEDYFGKVQLSNIGIIGFSDALDVTGEATNHGDLIIDEVELTIIYLNVADRTGFTEQHKLIGESSSPKPLRPGRTQAFEYRINPEYYAKAPEVKVRITNLQIRSPEE